jgi:hypothetical protein
MNRAIVLTALLLAGADAARAQIVSLGVQGALGDYREVSDTLNYRGTGGGVSLEVRRHKLSAEVSASRVSYVPKDESRGLTNFTATQLDARLGYDLAAGLTAEVGLLRRTVTPELAAQEMGAARIGVRYSKLIGPGTTVALRGNYLAGAQFTGKGSAGLAFELGLLVSTGPVNGRYRLTGDYGFQRVDRKVGGVKVPLQQSLVRVGVAVEF